LNSKFSCLSLLSAETLGMPTIPSYIADFEDLIWGGGKKNVGYLIHNLLNISNLIIN
jgi:hypothetical protein